MEMAAMVAPPLYLHVKGLPPLPPVPLDSDALMLESPEPGSAARQTGDNEPRLSGAGGRAPSVEGPADSHEAADVRPSGSAAVFSML